MTGGITVSFKCIDDAWDEKIIVPTGHKKINEVAVKTHRIYLPADRVGIKECPECDDGFERYLDGAYSSERCDLCKTSHGWVIGGEDD